MPRHAWFLVRWARRAVSLPLLGLAWLLACAALLALPLVALGDLLLRRRLAASRMLLALFALASCEVLGVLAALGLGLLAPFVARTRFLGWNARLQRRWVEALFAGLRRLYGLRLEVEAPPGSTEPGAPLVVLVRHVSLVDTLLPLLVLDRRWSLRYVLKRELLWDPCLDLVGLRLPNAFVNREGDPGEAARVAALAEGLGPAQGVVIYPEGTRFSPARRERVLRSLEQGGLPIAALERARALQHVLPPRPGGVLGLLAACPAADVLLVAHTGLEGARTLGSLWRGELIGRTVRVRLWRIPAWELPAGREPQTAWLNGQWERVDAWLAGQ